MECVLDAQARHQQEESELSTRRTVALHDESGYSPDLLVSASNSPAHV